MAFSTSAAAAVPYFDFRTAEHLPETHVWSGPYNYPTVEAVGREMVPVVDMSGNPNEVVRAVARAAEEWGGFLLVGHGVPAGAMARMHEQVTRLFALPMPEKIHAGRQAGATNGYGVLPYKLDINKLMWSEGYTFLPDDIRTEFCRVWPDGGDEYLRFCEVMEEYHREMKAASGRVLDIFYRALGLTNNQIAAGEMERKISDTLTPSMHMRLYPKCPDPESAMGLLAHTDSGFFSLIMQNLVPGLQLLRRAPDRWVPVPALPGAFAVLRGDLFHVLTNGRFQSSLHRAVVNSEQDRISVPYFLRPPADMVVAPLASTMLPGTKARFRAVTWAEYMVLRKKTFGIHMPALNMLQIGADGEEEAHEN